MKIRHKVVRCCFLQLMLLSISGFPVFGMDCNWEETKARVGGNDSDNDLIRQYVKEYAACLQAHGADSADHYLRTIANDPEWGNSCLVKASVEAELGQFHEAHNNFAEALYWYLRQEDTWNSCGQHYEIAQTDMAIANLYNKVGEFSKEHHYLHKAYGLFVKTGLKQPIATAASRLGFYLKENGFYDSALLYLEEAKLLQQEVDDQAGLVYTLNHIGRVHKDRREWVKANEHYREALARAKLVRKHHPRAWTLINLGFLELDQQKYQIAEPYFRQALQLAEQNSLPEILRLGFEGLYRTAEETGRYESAFHHFKKYLSMGESMRKTEHAAKLAEAQWMYQQELQKKDQEIKEVRYQKDRLRQLLWMLIAITLLIGLGAVVYFQQQQLRRAAQENQELDTKLSHYVERLDRQSQENGSTDAAIQWVDIEEMVHQRYPAFKANLLRKHPRLSEQDIRFCMLLLSSFSTKEIAGFFNISPASANKSRYRIRRKLGITTGEDLLPYLIEQAAD